MATRDEMEWAARSVLEYRGCPADIMLCARVTLEAATADGFCPECSDESHSCYGECKDYIPRPAGEPK